MLSDLIGEMESASLFKRIKGFSFSSDRNKPARLAERNEKIESWDLSFVEYPTQNNIVEQDHRFIKRHVKPGLGFFSIESAWRTLQGYEVMNIVRKGQMRGVEKGDIMGQIAFIADLFRMAA